MALGDNGKKQEYNENTYYSRIRFKNNDLGVSFAFWKGLLKISISKMTQEGNNFSNEELTFIHLSPMKATVLLEALKAYRESTDGKKLYGVDTGMGEVRNIITFGIDASVKEGLQRYMVIGKVSPSGELLNPTRFNFNCNYHFSIEWKNLEKMDCNKVYHDNAEIDLFISVLDQFVKAMTGSMCYSVMDMGRFDYSRMNTKIELVMDALHIERPTRNQGNPSNSFFNKTGAGSPQNTNRGRSSEMSLDDLEESLLG